MLAAFRRHFQSPDTSASPSRASPSPRPVPIAQSLQNKFVNGITTNLRILICGSRKSGKSSLMRRLRGQPHQLEYEPTSEVINAATVNWNYKATSEVIKVDAWEMQEQVQNDYYRGSSAMMFMYNANEPYELDNVLTMVNQVPSDMPILIIGNFMDLNPMLENDETDRVGKISSTRTTPVYYCKGSMATGRGLNMIYKFLNVPYLFTRERELQRSLENSRMEYSAAKMEIELLQNTQDNTPIRSVTDFNECIDKEAKHSTPTDDMVLADDDEISDEEELFNKMLIIERSKTNGKREVEGMEHSSLPTMSGDSIHVTDTQLTDIKSTASVEDDSTSSVEVEEDDDRLDTNDLQHRVRVRPVGKSRDNTPTQLTPRVDLDPPTSVTGLSMKSPDLRAPLALPDSPFSSTVGDSSVMSSLYTNQSLSSQESDIQNGLSYDAPNHTNSSTNNFLLSEESEENSTDSQKANL